MVGGPIPPAKVFEVIDGQQRLTTAFLFMAALVKVLANIKEFDEASRSRRTIFRSAAITESNLRIHSSRLDRSMVAAVIEDVQSDTKFIEALSPYTLNALPSMVPRREARSGNNYNRFKRFFTEFEQGGLSRVRQIYEVFLNSFTIVQIDVIDPTDGRKYSTA
jgi:hypothetical protein